MIAHFELGGHRLHVNFAAGVPIAIPLDPHGPQPAYFIDEPASARPLRAGSYIGDVRLGGTCNAEVVQLVPHCHGTHTECRGHLTRERLIVQETIDDTPCLAQLVSVTPENVSEDDYPRWTRAALESALAPTLEAVLPLEALVLRTLPNNPGKRSVAYEHAPPYPVFAEDAIAWLASLELRHLLVDTPSLDPAHDAGRMWVHRLWWCMADNEGPGEVDPRRRSTTEMIFVPDEVGDGLYWLDLGLSPLLGDATLSRPTLYPAEVTS
ncbi:MAG: cyclase family protein [Pseudomonadota bacterium]